MSGGGALPQYGEGLTPLEQDTLYHLACGHSATTLSRKHGLTRSTVSNRVMRAGVKLGTVSVTATVVEALRRGEIPFPRPDQVVPRSGWRAR